MEALQDQKARAPVTALAAACACGGEGLLPLQPSSQPTGPLKAPQTPLHSPTLRRKHSRLWKRGNPRTRNGPRTSRGRGLLRKPAFSRCAPRPDLGGTASPQQLSGWPKAGKVQSEHKEANTQIRLQVLRSVVELRARPRGDICMISADKPAKPSSSAFRQEGKARPPPCPPAEGGHGALEGAAHPSLAGPGSRVSLWQQVQTQARPASGWGLCSLPMPGCSTQRPALSAHLPGQYFPSTRCLLFLWPVPQHCLLGCRVLGATLDS